MGLALETAEAFRDILCWEGGQEVNSSSDSDGGMMEEILLEQCTSEGKKAQRQLYKTVNLRMGVSASCVPVDSALPLSFTPAPRCVNGSSI